MLPSPHTLLTFSEDVRDRDMHGRVSMLVSCLALRLPENGGGCGTGLGSLNDTRRGPS